jgi:hypothetical protein
MQTMLVCCAVVLLITSTAFFAYDLVSFRQGSLRQLRTLGEAIASNSTAALAFGFSEDAALVLSALKADPDITAAALYDIDGDVLAAYPESLDRALLPARPQSGGYALRGLKVIGFQPVRERSRPVGTLYVESDLGAIFHRAGLYGLIALLVTGLAGLAAYVVSRQMNRRLMQPILALKDTAEAVWHRQDYTVRALRSGTREFDALTDAFNHMLGEIQQSEEKLRAQVGRLGLLQHITRAIGDRQDMASIFEVVLGNLEQNVPVDFACVLLHEATTRELSVGRIGPASRARAEALGLVEGRALPVDQNGLARCLLGHLVYEPDVSEVPFDFARRLAAAELRSVVFAPLMFESDVHGVMVCARSAADAFSSGQCEFMKQLGEHVALASRQATLYGALQQAYDDLRQSQLTILQQERLRALGQMASGIAHDINRRRQRDSRRADQPRIQRRRCHAGGWNPDGANPLRNGSGPRRGGRGGQRHRRGHG